MSQDHTYDDLEEAFDVLYGELERQLAADDLTIQEKQALYDEIRYIEESLLE